MRKVSKLFLIFLFLFFILNSLSSVYAQIPHLINYQGRLTNNDGVPLDGIYEVTFRIYDVETNGAPIWMEKHTGLDIDKGVLSVMLGSVTDLDLAFDKPYFLEIKVNDEIMAPRQRITSVGYAIAAENVKSIPRGMIVLWSGAISDIPSGWALCDGNNGTPNLTDRFVIHADADTGGIRNVGAAGGEHTHVLTIDEMPAHTHEIDLDLYDQGSSHVHTESLTGSHGGLKEKTHTINSTGGGSAHNNMPKYYALAYIMKL